MAMLRVNDVLTKMNQARYRHLPVVANDMLVGVITDRDLRLAVNSPLVGMISYIDFLKHYAANP